MSLYLAVFESDDADVEVDGVDVGGYGDFGDLRATICAALEDGQWGARFPVLLDVPDTGPTWPVSALPDLAVEIDEIRRGLGALEPTTFAPGSWQAEVGRRQGLRPTTLADCFVDVDGEPLLDRLAALVATALERRRPIEFQ